MSRELTERQQKFLAVLFDEAGGDVVQLKLLQVMLKALVLQI